MAKPGLPIWVEKDKAYALMMGDGYSNALFVGAPDKEDKFYAHVKLEFWGEVKLEFEHEGRDGVPFVQDIPEVESIEAGVPARKIILEDADLREEWYTPDQINFKWVRVLKTKPTTNVFTWKLMYADQYTFNYQIPFRERFPDYPDSAFRYTTENGKPCVEVHHANGTYDGHPIEIEGSIVVFHRTKRHHQVGQTNYRMGKVLHIPRPKVVDKDGKAWWCDIAVVGNEYRLTIPQDALDKGVYPLTINDTLGYWCAGGSYSSIGENYEYATGPFAGADGSATHINLYWQWAAGAVAHDATAGFWKDNAGVPDVLMADTAEFRVVENPAWQQIALDSATAISSVEAYHAGFNSIDENDGSAGYIRWYYDAVSDIDWNYDQEAYTAGSLTQFVSEGSVADRAYSAYITYTPSGPEGMVMPVVSSDGIHSAVFGGQVVQG